MPKVPHIVGDEGDAVDFNGDDQAEIYNGDRNPQDSGSESSDSSSSSSSSTDSDSDDNGSNDTSTDEEDWSNNISYLVRTPSRESEQLAKAEREAVEFRHTLEEIIEDPPQIEFEPIDLSDNFEEEAYVHALIDDMAETSQANLNEWRSSTVEDKKNVSSGTLEFDTHLTRKELELERERVQKLEKEKVERVDKEKVTKLEEKSVDAPEKKNMDTMEKTKEKGEQEKQEKEKQDQEKVERENMDKEKEKEKSEKEKIEKEKAENKTEKKNAEKEKADKDSEKRVKEKAEKKLEKENAERPNENGVDNLEKSPSVKPSSSTPTEETSPFSRRRTLRSAANKPLMETSPSTEKPVRGRPLKLKFDSEDSSPTTKSYASPAAKRLRRTAPKSQKSPKKSLQKLANPVEVTEYFTQVSATLVRNRVDLKAFKQMRSVVDRLVGQAVAITKIKRK